MSELKNVEEKIEYSFDFYKFILLPGTILFLVISGFMMLVIFEVRIKELKHTLQKVNQQDSGSALRLISRYELIKKRYVSSAESAKDYLKEGELLAAQSGEFNGAKLSIDSLSFLEKPAIVVVNVFASITGTPKVRDLAEDRGYKLLGIAYFYERKREFSNAINIYNTALKHYEGDIENLAYIYLHMGFCRSFISKLDEALANYEKVSKMNDGVMGTVADVLAGLLRNVNKGLVRVERMRKSVQKGASYYKLMAYNQAIDTLNDLEKSKKTQKLYFYRGRSYEELGNSKSATVDYRRVIKIDSRSDYAKNANRRIYLLGAFYADNKKLKEESKKNAITLKDTAFIKKVENFEKAVDKKNISHLKKDEAIKKTLEFVKETTGKTVFVAKGEPLEKVEVKQPEKIKQVFKEEPKPLKEKNAYLKKKIADPTLSKNQRKELFKKRYKKLDMIYTRDGQRFVGRVIAKSNAQVTIVTMSEVIRVPDNKIVMRLKKDSKFVLK